MKKTLLILIFSLVGCSSSVYESGWNGKISGEIFHECAQSSFAKGFYFNENVDRLVKIGLLTEYEASRAKAHQVAVGDKECVAYAAYGFRPSKYIFSKNTKGYLVSRAVEYRCNDSEISCPGKTFTVVDGVVTNISPVKD